MKCLQCGEHVSLKQLEDVYDRNGLLLPLHKGGCPRKVVRDTVR